MKYIFRKYGLLFGAAICVAIFMLEYQFMFFGVFINQFIRCENNPAFSAPCYLEYDVGFILITAIAAVILTILFIVNKIKK